MLAWKKKKQLKFPLFPGRNYSTWIPKHINIPGVPCRSRIRIPVYFLSSAMVTSLPSVLVLTWLFYTCQDHPFPLCHVSVQWSLKYGSSLCQDIYLVLLSIEIILKYSFSSLVLCQCCFLFFFWDAVWRTIGSISDTSIFVNGMIIHLFFGDGRIEPGITSQ